MTTERPIVPSQTPLPSLQRLLPGVRRLAPRPLDQIALVLYPAGVLYFVATHLPIYCACPFPWAVVAGLVAACLGLLALDYWEYTRYGATPPRTVAIALLVVRTVLIITSVQLQAPAPLVSYFYLMVPLLGALTIGRWVGWALGGVMWLYLMAQLDLVRPGWEFDPLIATEVFLFSLGIIFIMTIARLIRQEQEARAHTEQLLLALEQSHQHVAVLATVEERNRIARDIHDSLGHYLTVINVQLEKALAFRLKDGAVADQAVADAKRLAREALDDVRRSVGVLRTTQEPFVLTRELSLLVDRVRSGRLAVTLNVEGAGDDVPQLVQLALYRAAQEALTNVQRHAQAQAVDVVLRVTADTAELAVRDDGVGFDGASEAQEAPATAGGYGLIGIEERIASLGGTVTLRSSPGGGTTLTASVPLPPKTQTAVPSPPQVSVR
jgi:signal transduction histidine kinase